MKIAYDISILEIENYTGVENNAYNLFREIWRLRPDYSHFLICKSKPYFPEGLPENCTVVETGESRLWRWIKLRKVLKSLKADCLLSGVTNTTFPCGVPLYPYVHECQWRYQTNEKGFFKQKIALKISSLWTRAIITNCNYTKSDIEKEIIFKRDFILAPPSYSLNIKVEQSRKDLLNKYNIKDCDYYLFASSIRPKKNVDLLIDAFSQPEMSEKTLILAGKVLDKSILHKAELFSNIYFLGYVSDEDLACLYENAMAFLYISLNEGFGLPILESYYYKTPVIASKCGSIPEVAGDAAVYISGNDTGELLNIIKNFTPPENFESKAQLILDKYSWVKSAESILSYIEKQS